MSRELDIQAVMFFVKTLDTVTLTDESIVTDDDLRTKEIDYSNDEYTHLSIQTLIDEIDVLTLCRNEWLVAALLNEELYFESNLNKLLSGPLSNEVIKTYFDKNLQGSFLINSVERSDSKVIVNVTMDGEVKTFNFVRTNT